MMRQSQGALRLLLRMQAVREKRESTNRSCDRAAFTEQWNTDLMAEALAAQPSPAAPQAAPAPEPSPTAEPCPAPAAEQPITLHPHPAMPIRRAPRVPNGIPFTPPGNSIALIAANGSAVPTPDEYRPPEPVN